MSGVSTPTRCRSCGETIVFVTSTKGAPIPCNLDPVTVVLADGRVVTGRISHFATCPSADHHRKRATAGPELDRDAIRAIMAAGFEVVTPAGLPLGGITYVTLAGATEARSRHTGGGKLTLHIRWKNGEVLTQGEARLVQDLERGDQGEQLGLPDDPRPNSPEDLGGGS